MRGVVVAAYWCGIDALFYFLNRHAKRILCFHNVLPDELFRADLSGGGVMRLSEFERIVKICKKKFPITTDMQDPKSLTFTFDDGYRNQYTVAFPCMKRLGVPGCIFVSGQKEAPLIIDQLVHWNRLAPLSAIENRREFWRMKIWPLYQQDGEHRGQAAVDFCNSVYPMESAFNQMSSAYREQRFGFIADAELDEMRKSGWMVGWHTKSHYPLAFLSHEEVRKEMTPPVDGMRNVCFSYPYGVESKVGNDAVECAREIGYSCAVSDTMNSPLNSNCHFMARMEPPADKYRLHYELSGMGHFMRRHQLLPRVKGGR